MYVKKNIAIIGGGPAAMTLAAFIDPLNYHVSLYEQQKTLGRKFLVAGKGGFNLTHSEDPKSMIQKYSPSSFIKKSLQEFNNDDLRQWLSNIGIVTYVGSSKRVFPKKGIKPIEVLNAIIEKLHEKDLSIHTEHSWCGWNESGDLIFNNNKIVRANYVVFALGGGSWKITGSDGLWLKYFQQKGIKTTPFAASNCAYEVAWGTTFINSYEGTPLKNIALRCGDVRKKGELVITRYGLEGNAIYALSPEIRTILTREPTATVYLDLKPNLSAENLLSKLETSLHKNIGDKLKNSIKLKPVHIQLIKSTLSKVAYTDHRTLCETIKNLPISLINAAPIDKAISTVGGISLSAVNAQFELKKMPHHYCIGEMLDWDAPTGGYLLQASFSMAVKLAKYLNEQDL